MSSPSWWHSFGANLQCGILARRDLGEISQLTEIHGTKLVSLRSQCIHIAMSYIIDAPIGSAQGDGG
jgi:hypothetical protein